MLSPSVKILFVLMFGLSVQAAPKKKLDPGEAQFLKTLEVELKQDPQNQKAREKLAQLYFRSKQFEKVIAILKGYKSTISDKSLSRLASSYKRTGEVEKEIQVLQQLSKARPNSYKPHLALGNAFLKTLKKPDVGRALLRSDIQNNNKIETKAIFHYREAIRLSKKFQEPYDRLLAFFLERDNHYEAQKLLEGMMQKFGKKGVYYSHLCRLFSVQAFLEQSHKTCSSAIRKDRKNPDNYVYLANTFFDMKKKAKAIKFLVKATKKFPGNFFVHSSLAKNYQREENFLLASKHHRIATQLKPDAKESIIGLAESLFQIEKYDEALTYYKRACQMDRTYKLRLRVATNTLKKEGKYKYVPDYQDEVTACR